ncbi:ADP-ribosylation factor 1-like protein [Aphelenchoides avenae]|nr:ADP-ribosylation factor 1-like protein [Aphelenchus avenae]
MGNVLAQAVCRTSRKQDVRVAMAGLDAAGKTTLLYQLKLGVDVKPLPTVSSFNSETIICGSFAFTLCDMGSWPSRMRPLWPHYFPNCRALIFVVDCADPERLDEARLELAGMLANDCFINTILLVYANKQDLLTAISATGLMDRLRL